MKYCDLTLKSPQENLACDEVLLDVAEDDGGGEVLRFWESDCHFVVLGYANRAATEANLEFCRAHDIPVLRRCTGGGTVLQGPGCLNYSLILGITESGPLHSISAANEHILERLRGALAPMLSEAIERQGQSDLAAGGLKFCGNAQRRKKRFLLFHGSLLMNLDITLVEKALPQPTKQPSYRVGRPHGEFMLNLKLPAAALKAALRQAWGAGQPLDEIPLDRIRRLVREKYGLADWNLKF